MNYTEMQLELWDKAYNWHPFTPMASYLESQPIIITKAHGFFWWISLATNTSMGFLLYGATCMGIKCRS
jgi:adenosylmethionine-8-amino-7-oxononanoate aminotransferase